MVLHIAYPINKYLACENNPQLFNIFYDQSIKCYDLNFFKLNILNKLKYI